MQKEREDNKYTFIAEYQGGTYISQCVTSSVYDAIEIWCTSLNVDFLPSKKIDKLLSIYRNEVHSPVSVQGVHNVWCCSYTLNRSLILLNIIKTSR